MVLVPHGMLLHHAAHAPISFGSLGAGKKTLGVDAALNQWVISPSSCSSLAISSAAAVAAAWVVAAVAAVAAAAAAAISPSSRSRLAMVVAAALVIRGGKSQRAGFVEAD